MYLKFLERNYAIIEEQVNANSHLEDKIAMDQKTELYNHEVFYERLEETIGKTKSRYGGEEFAVIFCEKNLDYLYMSKRNGKTKSYPA